jgi:putative transposase
MESFFALLQKNVLNRLRRWRTRSELRDEIVHWIKHTYKLPGDVAPTWG